MRKTGKDPFKTQRIVTNDSGPRSYAYSVNNPNTFIKYSGDWHTPQNTAYPWNGSSDKKSIYDPCPAGWRVPEKELWTGFDYNNFVWDDTNKGRTYDSKAWYPAAGFRDYSSSSLDSVGTYGHYWSSSPLSTAIGFHLYFNSSGVLPSSYTSRAYGFSVRCVQE